MNETPVKALLLDIGGVILTKGWDRHSRKEAAEKFGLDYDEMDDRHQLVFHLYEEGRLTLDEYLHLMVFYCKRDFTPDDFKEFMFTQSEPYPDMLNFCKDIKKRYGLKVVALSNEGKEITEYRIEKFDLLSLIDFFVCSCFVQTLKPDPAIFHFAMDQVQLCRRDVLYVDDTSLHVEVARGIGIPTIHHKDYESTREAFIDYGLSLNE